MQLHALVTYALGTDRHNTLHRQEKFQETNSHSPVFVCCTPGLIVWLNTTLTWVLVKLGTHLVSLNRFCPGSQCMCLPPKALITIHGK